MRISGNRLLSCGLQLTAVAALAMSPLAASADPNKCGKELTKWGEKGQTDTGKELQKCIDGVQKEVDKAEKGKLDKASEKCQKSMDKIGLSAADIVNDGKSKLGKALQKIIAAAGGNNPKCTTSDVQLAGFPSGSVTDAGRILMAQAVGDAWQQQLQTNGTSYANMVVASDEGACPECSIFVRDTAGDGNTNGPCPRLACTLTGSSGINTTALGNFPVPVSLLGDVTAVACDLPQVYPDTIVLYSGPSGAISAEFALADVCIDTFRSQGTLATGNASVNDYDTSACADKNATTSNECGGFTNCITEVAPIGGQNTETCYDIAAGSAGTGLGSLQLSQRLTVVLGAVAPGVANCPNDSVAPSEPTSVVLTTGQATAELYDGSAITGSIGTLNLTTTLTGSAFSNPETLSGGTWVGAFATVDDGGVCDDQSTNEGDPCSGDAECDGGACAETGVGDSITDLTFECL